MLGLWQNVLDQRQNQNISLLHFIEKIFQKKSYYCITFPILNSLDDFPNVKCHTVISNLLYETMQPYYFNSLHPIRILLMKISLTRGPVYFVTSFLLVYLSKIAAKI